MTIFSDRHAHLLDRSTNIKEQVMEKLYNKIMEKPNEIDGGQVESIVKITSALEKGIIDVKKVEIAQEKNNIDKTAGDSFAAFLEQLHVEDNAAFQRAKEAEAAIPQFESTGVELTRGEVIYGKDGMTSAQFKTENDIE